MEQETLIYIDDKEKYNASVAANFYKDKDTRNRTYINTLGAELALKYIASENISTGNIQNIHSVKAILEEFDISDIMLKNVHIDVRVVFDENLIFIPKSHFEYNLVPDVYVVFQLASDSSHVKFLGFFEPGLVNKNNENDKYYFIEKEKLSSPLDFIKYIKNFNGSTNMFEPEDYEELVGSFFDKNISETEKKNLFKQLTKSSDLREKTIEYENFEMLSKKAMSDVSIVKPKISVEEVSENFSFENTDDFADVDVSSEDSSFDIDGVLAGGALAAGAVAGAEILGAEAGTSEVLQGAENLVDFADEGLELVSDSFKSGENFGNAAEETANLNIVEPLEANIDEATVNLDTIEPLETNDNVVSEEIVNLDEIEDLSQNEPTVDFQDETAKLEDFNPVNENLEDTVSEEDAVDINSVELSEAAPIVEDHESETVSLDDFKEIADDGTVDSVNEELVSLENIDAKAPEIVDEAVDVDKINVSEFNIDGVGDISDSEINTDIESEITEDIISESFEDSENQNDLMQTENIQQQEDLKNATFGNNLLENLAAEENDAVFVEPMSDETVQTDSSELFSQLENVLVSSSAAEPNAIEDEISDDTSLSDEENLEDNIEPDSDDKLNVLFNSEEPSVNSENLEQLEEVPEQTYAGAALVREKSGNKNLVVTTLLLAALLGVGAFILFKPKPSDVADLDTIQTAEELGKTQNEELTGELGNQDASSENVLETNIPEINQKSSQEAQTEVKQAVTELKPNVKPRQSSSAFMSVSRLVWDVPTDLSYDSGIQTYLRTAGKSIKLSLSADLLLATEYAYTDHVKINLIMSKDGSVQSAKVVTSSGSSQIDNIVLQSVKDTLNVVKPSGNAVKTPDFNLNLIIYF